MSVAGLPLSQQIRLAFIDDCLQRSRRANRRDITSAFGVSVPTASLDFSVFVKTFPERVRYDAKAKRYRPVSGSVPIFSRDQRRTARNVVDAFAVAPALDSTEKAG
jgi:hypothetical protein